jgi:5-(carboxyamino)imidazole ribonucleotide synthase
MEKTRIGIVGGGQLCRMMGEDIESHDLPFYLSALDPQRRCPAKDYLKAHFVGDFEDPDMIRELASLSDVMTYEIELANGSALAALESEGKPVHPASEILKTVQDKYTQARFLWGRDIPVPGFMPLESARDFDMGVEAFGLPFVVKARTGSYDGRGNYLFEDRKQTQEVLAKFGERSLMAQQYIPFDAEVSVIVGRNIEGEIVIYPVGENIHGVDYQILRETIVPARIGEKPLMAAQAVAKDVIGALGGSGVFCIEMFVQGDNVLVNEIAPRVHNSGHYSIEACKTSQFQQHLRAISGMKLGDIGFSGPAVMHNIIGEEGHAGRYSISYDGGEVVGTCEVSPGVHVHNYGKVEVHPYRKIGHVTVTEYPGESIERLLERSDGVHSLIKISPIE